MRRKKAILDDIASEQRRKRLKEIVDDESNLSAWRGKRVTAKRGKQPPPPKQKQKQKNKLEPSDDLQQCDSDGGGEEVGIYELKSEGDDQQSKNVLLDELRLNKITKMPDLFQEDEVVAAAEEQEEDTQSNQEILDLIKLFKFTKAAKQATAMIPEGERAPAVITEDQSTKVLHILSSDDDEDNFLLEESRLIRRADDISEASQGLSQSTPFSKRLKVREEEIGDIAEQVFSRCNQQQMELLNQVEFQTIQKIPNATSEFEAQSVKQQKSQARSRKNNSSEDRDFNSNDSEGQKEKKKEKKLLAAMNRDPKIQVQRMRKGGGDDGDQQSGKSPLSKQSNDEEEANDSALSKIGKYVDENEEICDLPEEDDGEMIPEDDPHRDKRRSPRILSELKKPVYPSFLLKSTMKDKKGNFFGTASYDPTTLFISESDIMQMVPYFREYWRVKSDNLDKIVLVKLGRFYEAYFDDAEVCKLILSPKYTRQHKIGFPEEILFPYLKRLTSNNLKVVLVDQMETEGEQKARLRSMKERGEKINENTRLIKREVVAIYTKGTAALQLERSRKLDLSSHSSYILTIVTDREIASTERGLVFGLCFFDAVTGKIMLSYFEDDAILSVFQKLIYVFRPLEVVYRKGSVDGECLRILAQLPTKPLMSMLNDEADWNPQYAYHEFQKVFGGGEEQEDGKQWPLVLRQFAKFEDNAGYGKVYSAVSAMVKYMKNNMLFDETIPIAQYFYLDHINSLVVQGIEVAVAVEMTKKKQNQPKRLVLDSQTLCNLDILEVNYGSEHSNELLKEYSLFRLLDRTCTVFGERLMRAWVTSPLARKEAIEERLNAVEDLNNIAELRDAFHFELSKLSDLESILTRLYSYRVKNKGRGVYFQDVSKLRLNELKAFLSDLKEILGTLRDSLATETEQFKSRRLRLLVGGKSAEVEGEEKSLHESCMETIEQMEGKIFWVGGKGTIPTPVPGIWPPYDEKLAEVEELDLQLHAYLEEVRALFPGNEERIIFVHAKAPYQLDIPSELIVGKMKPTDFDLTSITKKSQRFYTPRLIKLIELQVHKQDQLKQYLADFTCQLFDQFFKKRHNWNQIVQVLAELDCLISLSQVSFHETMRMKMGQMSRPVIVETDEEGTTTYSSSKNYLKIVGGKHPCVCLSMGKEFVANNIVVNTRHAGEDFERILLVTGPNMGGKSTVLRTASVLLIMAQIGCYVPCAYMEFTLFDRIFTRIGMRDTLSQGKSTFFIELEETLNIVRNATSKSIVMIDELGRGTSTYDGVSLASGVLKYITEKNRSCCLFSTHSSILVEESNNKDIGLFKMDFAVVEEQEGEGETAQNRGRGKRFAIKFLYKFVRGEVQQSFARNVLRIAGIDQNIIFNAAYRSALLSVQHKFSLAESQQQQQQQPETKVSAFKEEVKMIVKTKQKKTQR